MIGIIILFLFFAFIFFCILSVACTGSAWPGILIYAATAIITLAVSSNKDKKEKNKREAEEKAQDEYIKDNEIHCDIDYRYNNLVENIAIRFVVDNAKKTIYISETSSSFLSIPFSEIIGLEILTDSEVTGGVGRAIVGGALAGGIGAVAGAATAKKQINSYDFIIYRKSIETPSNRIYLIKTPTQTYSKFYTQAIQFAYDVNACIKAIIEQNKDNSVDQLSSTAKQEKTDIAQELRKFKELMDEGIITRDEFEQKKKKLLEL